MGFSIVVFEFCFVSMKEKGFRTIKVQSRFFSIGVKVVVAKVVTAVASWLTEVKLGRVLYKVGIGGLIRLIGLGIVG